MSMRGRSDSVPWQELGNVSQIIPRSSQRDRRVSLQGKLNMILRQRQGEGGTYLTMDQQCVTVLMLLKHIAGTY